MVGDGDHISEQGSAQYSVRRYKLPRVRTHFGNGATMKAHTAHDYTCCLCTCSQAAGQRRTETWVDDI
eukprot:3556793-Rhodomonas_salina.2